MRVGCFRISYKMLGEVLNLRSNCRVIGIDGDWDGRIQTLKIYVEDPGLPVSAENIGGDWVAPTFPLQSLQEERR